MYDQQTKNWIDTVQKAIKENSQKIKELGLSEKALENYFIRQVEKVGGWAVKFNPSGNSGLPDRIIFYKGKTWLVELKKFNGKLSPGQIAVHKKFLKFGYTVLIIRSKKDIEIFIKKINNEI